MTWRRCAEDLRKFWLILLNKSEKYLGLEAIDKGRNGTIKHHSSYLIPWNVQFQHEMCNF